VSTTQHLIVTCSNCHSDGTDWVALGSLIAAIIAALIAGVALAWSRSEHNEFLRRLRARARLRVTLTPLQASPVPDLDDPLAVMAQDGLGYEQLFQVGVENYGDGAAGPAVINVLVPANVTVLYWSDGTGRRLDVPSGPLDTAETLTRDGVEVSARWISTELRRVSTRTPQLQFFKVGVAADVNRMPIRIKAQCDELPDEEFEATGDFELKLHSPRPPYGLRQMPV
jgi:hypothetical protein